ncbi:MAG: sigma-70 family RNA polymerase sigma factor, partial [Myxococcota bacterium]
MAKAAASKEVSVLGADQGPATGVQRAIPRKDAGRHNTPDPRPATKAKKAKVKRDKRMRWNDADAREALEKYEGTVRMMARRLRPVATLGQALDEEDLRAEGRVAVLEALHTYKGFGIAESTWVRTRIRQRLIDAIRKLDLRTRDEMRLAVKHAAGETEGVEAQRGKAIAARRLVSMDASTGDYEPMVNRLPSSAFRDAHSKAEDHHRFERLRAALTNLPERQRQAIEMGLFEGMALREIGDRMGISESRVCQLQKRAVQ